MKAEEGMPGANRLLAALPGQQYEVMLPDLEAVHLTLGQVLYEPGQLIDYLYFPVNCLVSMLAVVENHMALEVGLIGKEGVVGVAIAMGIPVTPVRALAQKAGMAMRIHATRFMQYMGQNLTLQQTLYRYAHGMMVHAMQIAVCNRYHPLEARLARSLLSMRDRLQSDAFHLTHEALAYKLGVRRVGVTNAAGALQLHHLIRYNRGDIQILDGKGLETVACSCYRIIASY